MVTGSVHSFDISTGVDGPGTRFVVFLAGCPLRCLYCHSPDTQYRRYGTPTSVDDLLLQIRAGADVPIRTRGSFGPAGIGRVSQPSANESGLAPCDRFLDVT